MKILSKSFVSSFILIFIVSNFHAQVSVLFSEDFSSNSFSTNNWSFPSGQSNWQLGSTNTPSGASAPNAYFNWTPVIYSYSASLLSNTINAQSVNGPVTLDYLLRYDPHVYTAFEQFKVEYKNTSSLTWTLLANYISGTVTSTQNWSNINVPLIGMTGQNFQIRFTAYGSNSFNITSWSIDNIVVRGTNCIASLPTMSISGSPTLCTGTSVSLTAVGGGASYTWFPSGGNGSVTVVSPNSNTTYSVLSSLVGCTASPVGSSKALTVFSNTSNIIATASSTNFCLGTSITLTAAGATTFSWSNGVTTASQVITPTASATYSVLAPDALGCLTSQTLNFIVNPNPTISIVSSNSIICPGNSSTLIATGALTYSWSSGGSGSLTSVSPTTNTNYTVTGIDALGCSSNASINISVLPPITIINSSTAICQGGSVTLISNGASTYTWSTGSIGQVLNVTPTVSTTYSVTGLYTYGCASSKTIHITVHQNPTVTITSPSSTICAGSIATLTAFGASTYTWSNNLISNILTFSASSSQIFSVSGTSAAGCLGSSNSASIGITVNPTPTISINSSAYQLCIGETATLSVNGGSNYNWNVGGTNSTITISPSVTSVYSVSGINSFSCSATQSIQIIVHPLPLIEISSSNTMICSGSTATLLANGAVSYSWNTGSTVNIIYVSPQLSSTYTVAGKDVNNCQNTKTVTLAVVQFPTVSVTSSDSVICAGELITLTANGANSYLWNNTSTGNVITDTPLSTTTYTLEGNSFGCKSTIFFNQLVEACTNINKSENTLEDYSIYPNPGSGIYTVNNYNYLKKVTLEIYTSSGISIRSIILSEGANIIDLRQQASGIYYFKFSTFEKQFFLKVVKF
jgi:hypothetical protein